MGVVLLVQLEPWHARLSQLSSIHVHEHAAIVAATNAMPSNKPMIFLILG
jgi:hypothetical protein